jgi:putative urate catabolism protein
MNYEEGGERSVLEGDSTCEVLNSELVGATAVAGRNVSIESMYEYGSRAGFWRLMSMFEVRQLPITIFGVATAMECNPEATAAMVESGHEIACHGWRWIDYQGVPEEVEREHMRLATASITRMTGKAPVGWYTGRASVNTRRLLVEHGGYLYDADSYADDLPTWVEVAARRHLVVPYAFDTNDMRFAMPAGFTNGTQFFEYLRDTFDVLYAEGADAPKMMSVGLHCRLAGRPGRMAAVARFLDHVERHDKVWICRREDIARHWMAPQPTT